MIPRALLVLAAALASMGFSNAFAQAYPAKPVRMVLPSAAGGGTDILGRILASKLSEMWGPAGHRRQQAGSELHHRDGRGGQGRARRLYVAVRAQSGADHQPRGAAATPLRSAARPRAGDHGDVQSVP